MFSKCPAHGVWLPVPGKPASGLGRSSQLRTRQGVCAGKDCCTQPNGYEPRPRLAFGSVYLGFYTHKQAPPYQKRTLTREHCGWPAAHPSPQEFPALTTGAPTAEVRELEQKLVPSRTKATLHAAGVCPSPSASPPATRVSTGRGRPGLADLHNVDSFKSPLS